MGPNEKVIPRYDLIILDRRRSRNRASIPDALREPTKEISPCAAPRWAAFLATFCCSHHESRPLRGESSSPPPPTPPLCCFAAWRATPSRQITPVIPPHRRDQIPQGLRLQNWSAEGAPPFVVRASACPHRHNSSEPHSPVTPGLLRIRGFRLGLPRRRTQSRTVAAVEAWTTNGLFVVRPSGRSSLIQPHPACIPPFFPLTRNRLRRGAVVLVLRVGPAVALEASAPPRRDHQMRRRRAVGADGVSRDRFHPAHESDPAGWSHRPRFCVMGDRVSAVVSRSRG